MSTLTYWSLYIHFIFFYFFLDAARIVCTFPLSISHEFEQFGSLHMCRPRNNMSAAARLQPGTHGLWIVNATNELPWRYKDADGPNTKIIKTLEMAVYTHNNIFRYSEKGEVCSSSISLYADDAKLYRRITTINDALFLQSDLDALFVWSQLWELNFNIKKCLQLSICRSLIVNYVYLLDHNVLERVESINDLGVTVSSNLSWFKNIKSISAKANSLLNMIRRSISFDASSPVKFQLYVSHVRSILEYCSPLWSPANVKDILLLERVQRHATKYILNNYSDMSYAERCIKLSFLPLCFRREIINLVLFYKYLHNYVDCDCSSYFELVESSHSLRSSNKGTLLKLPRVKTTVFQVSHFYRIVRLWNSLPWHIREASSVFSFEKTCQWPLLFIFM